MSELGKLEEEQFTLALADAEEHDSEMDAEGETDDDLGVEEEDDDDNLEDGTLLSVTCAASSTLPSAPGDVKQSGGPGSASSTVTGQVFQDTIPCFILTLQQLQCRSHYRPNQAQRQCCPRSNRRYALNSRY